MMFLVDDPVRTPTRSLPSPESAEADVRRLSAALHARRQAAPDNVVELAALAADLQRASAVWRRVSQQT